MKIAVIATLAIFLSGCMDAAHKPLAQLTLADLGRLLVQIWLVIASLWLAWHITEAAIDSRRNRRRREDQKIAAERKRLGYD